LVSTMHHPCADYLLGRLNYFTLDVIGDMAFGLPMGFVQNGCDRKQAQTQHGQLYEVPRTIDALQQGVRYSLTLAQAVSIETVHRLQAATRCLPWLKKVSRANHADDWENICINQLRRVSIFLPPPRGVQHDSIRSNRRPSFFANIRDGGLDLQRMNKGVAERPSGDFIHKMVADRNGDSRELPFRQLVAESLVFMNAGSDTTAAALSSTLYYLMSNPKCIAKLRAEVETRISPSDLEHIVPYDMVRDLPYLRACIDEALRLRPPIAYPLQRLVAAPEGAMIAGHHVKQGTVVAVAPYSIHRVESMFPDPDAYNPDRWLDKSDPEQLENLKAYNIVFSQGPRQCLGRHIAIVELQILISSLTRRYDLELMYEGQELLIFDRFNANPGPLPIQIRRRKVEDAVC
jgi:benzoate 4-monooxygenase